jgi:hypothetical protein
LFEEQGAAARGTTLARWRFWGCFEEMAILDEEEGAASEEVGTVFEDVCLVVEDACHAFEEGAIAS